MAKILITGANGFLGKNLTAELRNQGYNDLYLYTRYHSINDLERFTQDCDFVFHLAGVNRTKNEDEFMEVNRGLTYKLTQLLTENENAAPVLITSSIQAEKGSLYGESKKAGEEELKAYSRKTGINILIYRLPNVFGKWSKPNYNSVIATYCYRVARNMELQINDPSAVLELAYIDDVMQEFLKALKGDPTVIGEFCIVPQTYEIQLSDLAERISSFNEIRRSLTIPELGDELTKKLYSTYLSFLPQDNFSYDLKMNIDNRGSFTEFLRTPDRGQVSVNVSKPGVVKGNHWHHTKNEKFLVVCGKGLIRFRNVDSDEIFEYYTDAEKHQVVDIPAGYTHSIVNIGETDLVTVMWANESFDPENPDTHYLEV